MMDARERRREQLFNRTDEEWTAVYESGASEYWEDRAAYHQFQLADAEAEKERLRKALDDVDTILCKDGPRGEVEAEAQHIIATAIAEYD
jgi:hypothetical protein